MYFLTATAVSCLGLVLLLRFNKKRQRVYFKGRPQRGSHTLTLGGWLLVLIPGVALLFLGQWSAFLSWFGGLTVIGWLVAVKKPTAEQSP